MSKNLPAKLEPAEIDRYVTDLAKPRDYFSVVDELARRLDAAPDDPVGLVSISMAPPVIPSAHIPIIRRHLEDRLTPATEDDLEKAMAAFQASFKWSTAAVKVPEAYMSGMAIELRRYSYGVLSDIIRAARRTEEWVPAIATMVRLAEEEVRQTRRALATLKASERRAQELQLPQHRRPKLLK